MRLSPILVAVVLGAACGGCKKSTPASPTPSPGPTPTRHQILQYTAGPRTLSLDLLLPTSSSGPAPVIIYIHGADGSYTNGGLVDLAFAQADRGYAVASIEHRMPDSGVFPQHIQDCKAAVRWLRAHASTYNLNASRIGVWGTSFGGYLAALLGVTNGVAALEDPSQGNAAQSSRVQAVVVQSSYFNLADAGSADWLVSMLGCQPDACPGQVTAASPITYVDGSDSPFLLLHGAADDTVPSVQSERMHAALTAAGATSTILIFSGVGHTGSAWRASSAIQPVQSFFDTHLR